MSYVWLKSGWVHFSNDVNSSHHFVGFEQSSRYHVVDGLEETLSDKI